MDSIKLGDLEFQVIDQPHACLTHDLVAAVGTVMASGEELTGDTFAGVAGGSVYEFLCAFYPDLRERLPKHEFAGFASRTAHENGVFDREYAQRAPTFPQIAEAFDTALEANGRDVLAQMFGWVDPKAKALAWAMVRDKMVSLWENSVSLPPTSGESPPMSSGDSDQPSVSTIEESPSLV